jgi:hypothetical protein
MLKTTLYAEISAVGGLAMTLCIQAVGGAHHQWLLIPLIGLLVLATATARVMAHFHRIPAPLFEPLASAPSAVGDVAGSPRRLSNSPGARRHRLWPAADGLAANQAANSNAGLVNPARVRYPDAAASGEGRSPLRQLT